MGRSAVFESLVAQAAARMSAKVIPHRRMNSGTRPIVKRLQLGPRSHVRTYHSGGRLIERSKYDALGLSFCSLCALRPMPRMHRSKPPRVHLRTHERVTIRLRVDVSARRCALRFLVGPTSIPSIGWITPRRPATLGDGSYQFQPDHRL
jgi:hypothetical protein